MIIKYTGNFIVTFSGKINLSTPLSINNKYDTAQLQRYEIHSYIVLVILLFTAHVPTQRGQGP